jgi:hypothetical protein
MAQPALIERRMSRTERAMAIQANSRIARFCADCADAKAWPESLLSQRLPRPARPLRGDRQNAPDLLPCLDSRPILFRNSRARRARRRRPPGPRRAPGIVVITEIRNRDDRPRRGRTAGRRPRPRRQDLHARLVAARGAGLAVPAQDITRDVLERLGGAPALKQASREVADEIAAMPAPAELVEPLAALVHRPPAA